MITPDIPKNKVLESKKTGSRVVSIKRKYLSSLNQVCFLDSNFEYNYALYLDFLYDSQQIAGWVRNTTLFYFSEPIDNMRRNNNIQKAYRPDFIVFGLDGTYEIHEVKGWMNQKAINIDKQFRKDYPNLIYKLINKNDILALQSEYKDKVWGWEVIR